MKPDDPRRKNLRNIQEYSSRLTHEERQEQARKGQRASAQKKRDNRTFKELALLIMSEEATPEDIKRYNLPEGSSNSLVMLAAAAKKAKEGDMKALEVFRDTAGQMPTKEVQVSAEVFTEANKALLDKVAERIKKDE